MEAAKTPATLSRQRAGARCPPMRPYTGWLLEGARCVAKARDCSAASTETKVRGFPLRPHRAESDPLDFRSLV